MIIRKAELGDLRSLAELFDEYRVFYKKDSDILSAQSFLKERIEKNESEKDIAVGDGVYIRGLKRFVGNQELVG